MASVEKHRLRDEVELYREAQTMRRVAFFAVFVAATACMVGIVAVPMVYSYLQRVQSVLQVSWIALRDDLFQVSYETSPTRPATKKQEA